MSSGPPATGMPVTPLLLVFTRDGHTVCPQGGFSVVPPQRQLTISLQMPPKPPSSAFPGTTDQVLRLGRLGWGGACPLWRVERWQACGGEVGLLLSLSLFLRDFY